MTMSRENLSRLIAEDEFGLLEVPEITSPVTTEDRLVSAFLEVVDFFKTTGREPDLSSTDMHERKLASRLRALNSNDEQRAFLEDYDNVGLLYEPTPPSSLEDAFADDSLGLLEEGEDLFGLKHVPKTRIAPDHIARRKPCRDFDKFTGLFSACHADLRQGRRKLLPFSKPQQILQGSFFVLAGVLVYIAEIGERIQDSTGDSNARLRCIFENGTESDLLLRSLASQLYQDGRRVTEPELPRERMTLEPDTPMGIVYVLRSQSDDPMIRNIPDLHKIGCTRLTTAHRTREAFKETTYMMQPVETVAEYEVPAGVEARVEHLLHQLFSSVRLDVAFEREGATLAEAHEWFSVPLKVIDEAMDLIATEAITNYEYDPDLRRLTLLRTGKRSPTSTNN